LILLVRYLWPVGFKATRLFASQYNPDEKVEYHCAILDSDDGPVVGLSFIPVSHILIAFKFQVIPEDDKDNPIVEKTPTDAHRRILININRVSFPTLLLTYLLLLYVKAKRRDVKHLGAGPGFFGISNQTVVDMLNQMPESHLAWQTEPSKYEAISGRVDHKPSRRQSSCFSEDEELDENSAIEDGRSSENELWREKK
jgi:hypothetical protein